MNVYKVNVTICETVLREGWVSVEATSEADAMKAALDPSNHLDSGTGDFLDCLNWEVEEAHSAEREGD